MYFNDLHILYYITIAIIGLVVGKIAGNYNQKVIEDKKNKEKKKKKKIEESNEKKSKDHYVIMILNSLIYILLLYTYGLQKELVNNFELIQNMVITPFLLSIVSIDSKLKIIPNRIVVTLLEIGIAFIFLYGMYDINVAGNRVVGGILGITIFLGITLLANLISGSETMGYGDVKLVGVLGLYFGMTEIMVLSVGAFIICAIVSIILMLFRKIKVDEEIAFGPFISFTAFLLMFIPFNVILDFIIKTL